MTKFVLKILKAHRKPSGHGNDENTKLHFNLKFIFEKQFRQAKLLHKSHHVSQRNTFKINF